MACSADLHSVACRLVSLSAEVERTLKYALDVSQRLVVSREFRHQVGCQGMRATVLGGLLAGDLVVGCGRQRLLVVLRELRHQVGAGRSGFHGWAGLCSSLAAGCEQQCLVVSRESRHQVGNGDCVAVGR